MDVVADRESDGLPRVDFEGVDDVLALRLQVRDISAGGSGDQGVLLLGHTLSLAYGIRMAYIWPIWRTE